jgi:hypothetical protein
MEQEFVNIAAHELKSPVQSIQNYFLQIPNIVKAKNMDFLMRFIEILSD